MRKWRDGSGCKYVITVADASQLVVNTSDDIEAIKHRANDLANQFPGHEVVLYEAKTITCAETPRAETRPYQRT